MEDHIVLDVEIQKTIESLPGGWNDTHLMGVAVAVLYEFKTDRFRIYGPEDVVDLRERILKADRISGYNIWGFDYRVVWSLPKSEAVPEVLRPKTNDILLRIWKTLGGDRYKGWKLDTVVRATLNAPGKVANGAQAPQWYQAGLIHKVVNYCIDDVTLERDLAVFVDRYGFVRNDQKTLDLLPEWTP